MLFGEGEGRIALANRGKDPLLLFSALHRHLGYPEVPRPPKPDESPQLVPQLMRRVERLEARLKLVEEEMKGGIDHHAVLCAGRRRRHGQKDCGLAGNRSVLVARNVSRAIRQLLCLPRVSAGWYIR